MEALAKRFVLFDFDGVIADSLHLGHDVARIVHDEPGMTLNDYRSLFEGNVYHTLEKTGRERRDEEYFAAYAPRMDEEVTLVEGMRESIDTLSGEYTLAIISSTTTSLIRTFLAKHVLTEYFADVMGADVHPSKVEKMRMVFERYDTSAKDCVYITDTLGDMREAKEHEMGTIAVAWGWHDRLTLEKGIPFRIVEKPAELPDTVEDFFAR